LDVSAAASWSQSSNRGIDATPHPAPRPIRTGELLLRAWMRPLAVTFTRPSPRTRTRNGPAAGLTLRRSGGAEAPRSPQSRSLAHIGRAPPSRQERVRSPARLAQPAGGRTAAEDPEAASTRAACDFAVRRRNVVLRAPVLLSARTPRPDLEPC